MLLREDDRGVRCHLGNEDPLGGGFGWFSGCKGGLKGVFGCVLRAGWFYGVQGGVKGGFWMRFEGRLVLRGAMGKVNRGISMWFDSDCILYV